MNTGYSNQSQSLYTQYCAHKALDKSACKICSGYFQVGVYTGTLAPVQEPFLKWGMGAYPVLYGSAENVQLA